MKKTSIFLVTAFSFILFASCENNSEQDLIDLSASENTVTKTYNDDVKQIFNSSCISCHGDPPANGAPISFNTYTLFKDGVENGNILNRMNSTTNPMPPGGNLPASTIAIIEQWAADGYLEF